MTFVMIGVIVVLQLILNKKTKEKDLIEADARRRGLILEPSSWDFEFDKQTGKWKGSAYRLNALPYSMDISDVVSMIKSMCCLEATTNMPDAILEKIKINYCVRLGSTGGVSDFFSKWYDPVDSPVGVELRMIFSMHSPSQRKTTLHRLEGAIVQTSDVSENRLFFEKGVFLDRDAKATITIMQ